MWCGPQVQGGPVRWTCIRALCPRPDAFASRKSQGIPVLVLKAGERGPGWNHSFQITDRKIGSKRKGDSAQVRQPHLLLEETGWASRARSTYAPSPQWAAPRNPRCRLPSAPGRTGSQQGEPLPLWTRGG